MAKAEFEHLSSIIRVWNNDQSYGDPYWGAVIRWISKTEVEIELQQKKITADIYKAVMLECKKMGIEKILVRTFPQGSKGTVRMRWLKVK